jgi:hypothetical protein
MTANFECSLSAVCALFAALASPARAVQCENFGPLGPPIRTSQSDWYDQNSSVVARTTNGFFLVWTEGQDILFRRHDNALGPVSNDTLVNPWLGSGQQDEPAACGGSTGNVMIAWSDHTGYDGDQMGIFGRVYQPDGTPLGNEFQLNQTWYASQWRPLITPTPAGGFAVAWSGDWDGNAYYRLFSPVGTPLTNEITVNQFNFDAQVEPAIALGTNGTTFVAFVDFSSHAGYSGTDIWARLFNAAGTPLTNEFLVTSVWHHGDQRTPRVATDGQGHFNVVWQSLLVDGSGYAIVARRFDALGNGLAPEFLVNTTTLSDQMEPRIAMESDGDFLIAWHDYSTGLPRIVCRRFALDGTPKGDESVVSASPLGAVKPELWMSPNNGNVIIAYESWNQWDADVYARHYLESTTPQTYCTGKINTLGCLPQIGYTGAPSASIATPFDIWAINVFNHSPGLLFYGYSSAFTPFSGGLLCVGGPHRTQVQIATGPSIGHDCSGTFHYDFNARIQSGVDSSLTVGRTVSAQYYSRDLQDSFGSSLTNAVRFTICP